MSDRRRTHTGDLGRSAGGREGFVEMGFRVCASPKMTPTTSGDVNGKEVAQMVRIGQGIGFAAQRRSPF